jgi:hypothetical protein
MGPSTFSASAACHASQSQQLRCPLYACSTACYYTTSLNLRRRHQHGNVCSDPMVKRLMLVRVSFISQNLKCRLTIIISKDRTGTSLSTPNTVNMPVPPPQCANLVPSILPWALSSQPSSPTRAPTPRPTTAVPFGTISPFWLCSTP